MEGATTMSAAIMSKMYGDGGTLQLNGITMHIVAMTRHYDQNNGIAKVVIEAIASAEEIVAEAGIKQSGEDVRQTARRLFRWEEQ